MMFATQSLLLFLFRMVLTTHCVVVDAGHGGDHDAGATLGTIKEKTLTLTMANELREQLLQQLPHYQVVMPRGTDRDVSLGERIRFANQHDCEAFISLHVNSSRNAQLSGIETFYLDTFKSRFQQRLRETFMRIEGHRLSVTDLIARELEIKTVTQQSGELAVRMLKTVHRELASEYAGVRINSVKRDIFELLLGVRMPAILVEAGYLSNENDRQRLQNTHYRHLLEKAMALAVKEFLQPSLSKMQ